MDLAPALSRGRGHAIVELAAGAGGRWTSTWVQVTGIQVEVAADREAFEVLATSEAARRPLIGSARSLAGGEAVPLRGGVARISMQAVSETTAVIVETADDSALVPNPTLQGDESSWNPPSGGLKWLVLEPAALLGAADHYVLAGWVRRRTPAGTELSDVRTGHYVLQYLNGPVILEGDMEIDRAGAFRVTADLPADLRAGTVSLRLTATDSIAGPSAWHGHPRDLLGTERRDGGREEPRRMRTELLQPTPVAGGKVSVRVWPGGTRETPREAIPVRLRVGRSAAPTEVPGHPGFEFGTVREESVSFETAWGVFASPRTSNDWPPMAPVATGKTDATGSVDLEAPVPRASGSGTTTLWISSEVELNGKWGGPPPLLVPVPGDDLVLGLRATTRLVRLGGPISVDVVVVDRQGRPVRGVDVIVDSVPIREKDSVGPLLVEPVLPQCAFRSAGEIHRCELPNDAPRGRLIRGLARDRAGRLTEARTAVMVLPDKLPTGDRRTWLYVERAGTGPDNPTTVQVESPEQTGSWVLSSWTRAARLLRRTPFELADGHARIEVPYDGPDVEVWAAPAGEPPGHAKPRLGASVGRMRGDEREMLFSITRSPREPRRIRATLDSGQGDGGPWAEAEVTVFAECLAAGGHFGDTYSGDATSWSSGGQGPSVHLQSISSRAPGPGVRALDAGESSPSRDELLPRAELAQRLAQLFHLDPNPPPPRMVISYYVYPPYDPAGPPVPAKTHPTEVIAAGRMDGAGRAAFDLNLPGEQCLLRAAVVGDSSLGVLSATVGSPAFGR